VSKRYHVTTYYRNCQRYGSLGVLPLCLWSAVSPGATAGTGAYGGD
jgi:hypothetical protein